MVDKSIAITGLLAALAPGARVYLLERRRSRSDTTRSVDVVVVDDGAIVSIGADVATLVDLPWSQEYKTFEVRGSPRRVEELIAAVGVELFGEDHRVSAEWL